MSLLLISQAYSFSDEDENTAASTAKKKNSESLKDSGGDVESTVNLKRRTSLRLAKQFKTANRNGTAQNLDLKKKRKKLADCNSRLNNLSTKSRKKEETKLENEDEGFTPSSLDLLDQMETKNAKKTADQINDAPCKMTSFGKKNVSERNPQITSRQEFPLKIQQRKSLGPNQCIMCLGQFGRFDSLQIHILSHIGEKPFFCNVCNESFALSSTLKSHKLTHTGEKPYKCMICDKNFTKRYSLKEHQRTHTGEKPFTCSVCCTSFIYRSNLRMHKRIHSGEKPYQCKICSKRFPTSYSLRRHERIYTNEKRIKCFSCDKTFSRRDTLKQHTKINH